MLIASGVGSVLGLIRGFYVVRAMTPADYGVWSLISALLSYANYADIGINTGFILEVPRLLGGGQPGEAARMQRQAYTATLAIAGLVCVLVLLSSSSSTSIAGGYAASVRIVGIAVVVFALLNYYQVVVRIKHQWLAIGAATIATGAVGTAGVMLAGTVTGHVSVEAAAFFSVLGSGVAVLMLGYAGRSRPSWPLDWGALRYLIALGLPVSLLPITFTFFQNVDRWVVAAAVPATHMGYYALGTTLGLFLYLVPNTLAMVLFTRQIAESGAGHGLTRSESLVLIPIQLSGYVMAWIAGAMIVAMPFIIHYITPAYAPALRTASLQVVGNCLLFAVPVGANFLISVKQQRALVATLAAAMVFEAVLVAALVRTPSGIDGAAWAVLTSDAMYSGAVALLCLRLFGKGVPAHIGRVMLYFMPFGLCLPVALLVRMVNRVNGTLYADSGRLLWLVAMYLVVSGGLCLGAARTSGFLAEPFLATRIRERLPASMAAALLGKG